jgi:hypothetical protein
MFNSVWKVVWTICLLLNLFAWSTHWVMIGMAESFEEARSEITFWAPLAGFLTVYSAIMYMRLLREDNEKNQRTAA